MAVTLDLEVADIAQVIANYNVMQVQRSKLGTPYTDAELVTADATRKAYVEGTVEGPYDLQGTTLKLKVDGGSEQTVLFSGNNPYAITGVVAAFNGIVTGATASNSSGKLKIESNNTGSDGTIEITSGTSLTLLGLTAGAKDQGEDPHITLVLGTTTYKHTDASGLSTYYYRVRYYNTGTFVYSSWSDWMQIAQGAVTSGNLILATAKLAEVDGDALYNRGITIKQVVAMKKDGYFIGANVKRITTDVKGEAQTYLVKGATVDVVFEGTSVVRRILVPSTGTSFDLMDDSLVQHDPFEIKTSSIPYAVRRS